MLTDMLTHILRAAAKLVLSCPALLCIRYPLMIPFVAAQPRSESLCSCEYYVYTLDIEANTTVLPNYTLYQIADSDSPLAKSAGRD